MVVACGHGGSCGWTKFGISLHLRNDVKVIIIETIQIVL